MAFGDGASVYMLNNGNAIVQTPVAVSDSEKNYDVSMASDNVVVKLRLVTYLGNPLKGTQKKIKFNYLLANVYTRATASDTSTLMPRASRISVSDSNFRTNP